MKVRTDAYRNLKGGNCQTCIHSHRIVDKIGHPVATCSVGLKIMYTELLFFNIGRRDIL